MTDRRSVATDAVATIGTIIDETAGRDAIHMAVEPVVAGVDLWPGSPVRLIEGEAFRSADSAAVGIVDPFLPHDHPRKGERFWLVLYPRTITSLRHVWSHPDFPGTEVRSEAAPEIDPVEHSKKWIETFAAKIDQTVNRLMEAADLWVEDEEYTYDNSERYKNHWDEFPEFWKHYEIVTGRAPRPSERNSFFTCSC